MYRKEFLKISYVAKKLSSTYEESMGNRQNNLQITTWTGGVKNSS